MQDILMRVTYRGVLVFALATLAAIGVARAADPHGHAPPPPAADVTQPVLKLSPKLRSALVAEMIGLKQATGELAALLATGEWARAAVRAEQVRDSYIMKQKLSPAELAELEHALPADFIALDSRFHRHAEGLAHAAHSHDADLALFYYTQMLEGCVMCHGRYAAHSLTGFRAVAEPAHRH